MGKRTKDCPDKKCPDRSRRAPNDELPIGGRCRELRKDSSSKGDGEETTQQLPWIRPGEQTRNKSTDAEGKCTDDGVFTPEGLTCDEYNGALAARLAK